MFQSDLQQSRGSVATSTTERHRGNGTIGGHEHNMNHEEKRMAPRRLGGILSIPAQAAAMPFLEESDSDGQDGQTVSGIAQQVPHMSSNEKQQQRRQSEFLRRAAIDRLNRSTEQPATVHGRLQSTLDSAVENEFGEVNGVTMPQRAIARSSKDAISESADHYHSFNSMRRNEERATPSANNRESNPRPLLNSDEGHIQSETNAAEPMPKPFATSTRRLQLTVDDLELLQLRRDKMTYPAIAQRHFGRTGETRTSDSFRDRHRRVQSRIDAAGADPALVHRAQSGDRGALKQLNELLDRFSTVNRPPPVAPSGVKKAAPKQQPDRLLRQVNMLLDRFKTGDQPPPGASSGVKRAAEKKQPDRPLKRALTSRESSIPPPCHAPTTSKVGAASTASILSAYMDRLQVPHTDEPASNEVTTQPQIEQRQTQGGKTMNWEVFEALLGARTEDTADPMQQSWSALHREESPSTDLDFCHNIYQAQRRHRTAQDATEGVELEDLPWIDVGPAFETLAEANAYASRLVRKNLDGAPVIFDVDADYTTRSYKDEHGRQYVEMCCAAGEIQCRVAMRTRAFQEGIAPQSKIGWAPKVVYLVFRCVVNRARVDELFDIDIKSERLVRDEMMDNNVYSTLRQANQKAIETFVQAVFRSKSANLVQRELEQQAEVDRVTEDFQRQCNGQDMFHAEQEFEWQRVQVRVEKGSLKGPRNL